VSPALLICSSTEHETVKFAMKLFLGEKRVEAVLERLDLLTRDEVRMSAVQTLEAVYGLVQSMRLFMAGEQKQPISTTGS